jgi:hypothetical protein
MFVLNKNRVKNAIQAYLISIGNPGIEVIDMRVDYGGAFEIYYIGRDNIFLPPDAVPKTRVKE